MIDKYLTVLYTKKDKINFGGDEAVQEREISKAVIKRLPRYYRYLGELLEHKVERIS